MRVLVFDVNETLLDLAALDEPFRAAFGSADARREWFEQLLRSMLVSVIVGPYVEFPRIARGALELTAHRRGRSLDDTQMKAILGRIRELPAHPDVRMALERLRDAGFRLATLTNSTAEVAEAQLANAGIRELFAQVLSADAVQRLKPAPEPYRMAADALGVAVSDVRLVAAHAWDVAGALRVPRGSPSRPQRRRPPEDRRPDLCRSCSGEGPALSVRDPPGRPRFRHARRAIRPGRGAPTIHDLGGRATVGIPIDRSRYIEKQRYIRRH